MKYDAFYWNRIKKTLNENSQKYKPLLWLLMLPLFNPAENPSEEYSIQNIL